RNLGLRPTTCSVREDTDGSFQVRMEFATRSKNRTEKVELNIKRNGEVDCSVPIPDLTPESYKRTLIGLWVEFLAQVLRGHAHADPTGGNVRSTGASGISMWFDFANEFDLGILKLLRPAQYLVGMHLGFHQMAANALIALSNKAHVKGDERK